MARKKKVDKDIEQYDHADKKRLNNPPVGLVSTNTEPYSTSKKTYKYDPHLDPQPAIPAHRSSILVIAIL
jgi:adenine-specific DNA-methyltransferase